MAVNHKQPVELFVQSLKGLNTAAAPTALEVGQWRQCKNAYQTLLGVNAKRPGSVPLTTAALAQAVKTILTYKGQPADVAVGIYGASLDTLYKFDGADTLTAQTMTNVLVSDDIYAVGFTDAVESTRMIIGDTGNLKAYDASTGAVADVTPAADDASPAPANDLVNVNTKGIKYLWVHKYHIFVSDGSDTMWYTKRYTYDYIPSTQYEQLVRNNDYINGAGVSYNDVCLIPMRRGWNILTGNTVDDFATNNFLNTTAGVIAPHSIDIVTYPNKAQTVVYVSDNGLQEIYDTGATDAGSRVYATRSLMKDKIDWEGLGLTEAEKAAIRGRYIAKWNLYLMAYTHSGTDYVLAYDTRNVDANNVGEWYMWEGITFNSILEQDGVVYFVDASGHLKQFDETLATDWTDSAKTTGTPIDWDNYTDIIPLENSGFDSDLDTLMIWAKQFAEASTIDVYINLFSGTEEYDSLVKNQIMVWGSGIWGQAAWYNINFTDLVGKPVRQPINKKSVYFQIRFRNPRNERVELYRFRLQGRSSGK